MVKPGFGGVTPNTKYHIPNTKRAFTLIEIVIDFGIFAAVAAALVTGYYASYKSIDLARSQMVAVALANQRIEKLRNMPYDDLATQKGTIYPAGQIPDSEDVDMDGAKLTVLTRIDFYDDPFDGNAAGTIVGKPKDLYPYDYKRVSVVVSRTGRNGHLADITTNVAAKAAETTSNSGILNICVQDAITHPVAEATVRVQNSTLTPALDISVNTGDDGCIMLPKLPPDSHNSYHITITKSGYSTFATYPRTSQNPNACNPDVNVLNQQVENHVYNIDRLSTINLNFVDQRGEAVPNLAFTLEGSVKKYCNPDTFEYSQAFTAGSDGKVSVPNLRYDISGDAGGYKIKNLSSTYFLSSSSPMQSIELQPNTTLEVIAVTTDSSHPTVTNLSPTQGVRGGIVTVTVTGTNINNNATLQLVNPVTGAIINGSKVSIHPHTTISADFSLVGADTGLWNVVLTNSDGKSATQTNGFMVNQ